MRTERLNEIFSIVKPSLVPLIQAIAASSAKKSYKAPQPLEVSDLELIDQKHIGSAVYLMTLYTLSIHFLWQ